jgi:cell division protein FtsB
LDAGCAKGFLVETLRDRGIDARGIDISAYAIQEVYGPVKPYCTVASITEPFPTQYDLIVCIEVLEHMPSFEASKAIKNICEHTDTILFSSSASDYAEATHFNVHQPEYWVREFGYYDFYHDLDFDASFITSWAMLFRRQKRVLADLVFDYERNCSQIKNENTDLRRKNIDLEAKLHDLETVGASDGNPDLSQGLELLKSNNDALSQKIEKLNFQLRQKVSEIAALKTENTEIRSSTSWRLTKPLRSLKNVLKKDNRKG